MITLQTRSLVALVIAALLLIVGAAVTFGVLAKDKAPDVSKVECSTIDGAPYSNATLVPLNASSTSFVRFNKNGNGCLYIPEKDQWIVLNATPANENSNQ